MIRLILCDDHPVVRAGLKALLTTEPDIEVVAEATSAEDAIRVVTTTPADLVLMDLQFGGALDGADATRTILTAADAPYVLILTNYDTDADILGAVEAGASGYLLKDAPPDELLAAVRAAAAGQSALAPAVTSRLLERVRKPATSLSPRELDVLSLVAGGKSNAEVAVELFVGETTVKTHLVHIFEKLGVGSRTAAVNAARQTGLLRGN